MADIAFVLLLVGLFALTAAFVKACERMVGAGDEVVDTTATVVDKPERAAA